jgi:hypothetical protein
MKGKVKVRTQACAVPILIGVECVLSQGDSDPKQQAELKV